MRRQCKCIMCPVGCEIEIVLDDSGNVVEVIGGLCERGRNFAKETAGQNMQIVTTTIKLAKPVGEVRVVPVKTLTPVPVSQMKEVVSYLKTLVVQPPVKVGDVIADNIGGKYIIVVATRSVGTS
ncbi:MAG: DUF1667 domain-containing protein [Dictyoglomi bacterium]|nr:DUF1667 domain-containing protein [Dictyoglomota bacterium]